MHLALKITLLATLIVAAGCQATIRTADGGGIAVYPALEEGPDGTVTPGIAVVPLRGGYRRYGRHPGGYGHHSGPRIYGPSCFDVDAAGIHRDCSTYRQHQAADPFDFPERYLQCVEGKHEVRINEGLISCELEFAGSPKERVYFEYVPPQVVRGYLVDREMTRPLEYREYREYRPHSQQLFDSVRALCFQTARTSRMTFLQCMEAYGY